MARKWELRNGKVLVIEDADTASLVVVARDLKGPGDKANALREVLARLERA
ncbi:MAG: hypothetical protein P8099_06200 [Gemmatimonadota bacterium]|jgi:hypothetical protein